MSAEPTPPPPVIRVLAPEVAARIAAGEVIERPVSVIRELLDNAIDAGARRITVEVEDGGLALMRVTDDGRGIVPDQVETAFERHATSKIGSLGDLGSVRTLGFRGEALPSIAAAGDVELVTRAAGEPVGLAITLVDSRVARRAAKPAPVGTSFAVRDLFARLPARRKFLGTSAAETRQITVLVSHYALAYPGTSFAFVANGRRSLATAGDGDLRHAFAAVYGADAGAQMLDIDFTDEVARVTGLAGPPSLNRGNRAAISVFVNGRWVQSRPLTFAIVDAYQSQLPVGRHPIAALRIDVPSAEVDVNVHPAKAEVRFRDERAIGRAVRHAVGAALEGSRPVAWGWGERAEPGERDAIDAVRRPLTMPSLRQRLEVAPAALRPPEATQPRLAWEPSPVFAAVPGGAEPPSPATQREVLPLLRVVGQMNATYVICEGPDGMYLLDQHAAHERVNYDRIVMRQRGAEARQPLLEPVLADLDPLLAATLDEHRAHLDSLGLEVEPFGEGACLVRSVPPGIGGSDVASALRALLEQLGQERRVADPFGRAAATVACHASVRAGMALSMQEMRRLVEDLERTPNPRTCPHGRPTLVHLGTDAIERQFGRR